MKALKLDASYRPVGLIDAVEALVLCIVGKAKAIENYSKEIHSPSTTFKIPAVIVLKTIVRYHFTGIVCNRQNVIWRDKNICQYCGNKFSIEKLTSPIFVRMTGSGSTLVAYFASKKVCENAKKNFYKKYKNYWCIASKTI